jgi:hypothetical protein
LREQIGETHDRFLHAMSHRLSSVDADDLERYFAIVSNLVSKLEDDCKTLRQVAQEMVSETATIIMSELAK